jgi:acyl-[acyl-carrier-protein]-phospholipid O-acyltransferase/long-chain-fatty-acid--[acyl-carrier-protein] ligase
LIFPKTLVFVFASLVALITLTILKFIPPVLGTTLTIVLLAIVGIFVFTIAHKPEIALYALIWVMNHTLYKIKTVGHDNVPKTGGALLVSNSVSYIDHPIIFSSIKRPVKFFVGKEFREHIFLKPFLTPSNSIPIDSNDNPKAIGRALKQARQAIQNGELVCIFAEGDLTHTGNMLPFKRGFEFIVRNLDVPIIPIHLDRIWGSTFSFVNSKLKWNFPKVVPYPVTLSIGKPMPSLSRPFQVRLAVQELSAEAFKLRGDSQKKLHIGFINEVRKHPSKFCVADTTGLKFKFAQVFTIAANFARKIFNDKNTGEMVGIMLPSSVGSVLANLAVMFAGKIPVNLNFTSSKDIIDQCIKQCNMTRIISSRAFVDKINMHHFDNMTIFIEDVKASVKPLQYLAVRAAVMFLPATALIKIFVKGDTKNIDDTATVIFSSGTTGEPKGIMLTHQNIVSNLEAAYLAIKAQDDDIVAGILPFFHSFGYTATMWLVLYVGIGGAYHASPMDTQKVGELVEKFKCTLIFSTPTFLNAYQRKCTKEQFATLRNIVVGAEKLKNQLSQDFYNKFEKTVFEGYGATEVSPIVALGIHSFADPKTGKVQVGNKLGTVGHPLPGVAAKIVNQETFELMPFGSEGLLLVKGPNVMKGYLNNPGKTAEVIKDGWYITGDIAIIDADGFIAITDRLSRFSKIGGEMVPHVKVEEELQSVVNSDERFCFVTSVSDEKKGEKLVVLYKGEHNIDKIWNELSNKGLPKLWIPKKENFYKIEEFPLLGSGKTNFKKLKDLAGRFAAIK